MASLKLPASRDSRISVFLSFLMNRPDQPGRKTRLTFKKFIEELRQSRPNEMIHIIAPSNSAMDEDPYLLEQRGREFIRMIRYYTIDSRRTLNGKQLVAQKTRPTFDEQGKKFAFRGLTFHAPIEFEDDHPLRRIRFFPINSVPRVPELKRGRKKIA